MDAVRMTAWERAKVHTSLLCLLQGLQGKVATVELRNECSVKGQIEDVDGFMNTHMCDVIFTDMFDVETKMDRFYVKGSNIRFVVIPDDVNIIETMENRLKSLRSSGSHMATAHVMAKRNEARDRGRCYRRSKDQMKRDDALGASGSKPDLMQKSKAAGKERFKAYMKEQLEKTQTDKTKEADVDESKETKEK